MGTSGVLWDVDENTLRSLLQKHSGVINRVAKEVRMDRHTVKRKIEAFPALVELVNNLRENLCHTFIDMAENCLLVAMASQKEDSAGAIRAAMFTLNSRGKEWGWNNAFKPDGIQVSLCDFENIKMENEALKQKLNDISNEPKTEFELSGSNTPL